MKDVTLQLKNVGKSYGNKVVLESIDFEVRHGSMVALLGTSGAGKSTLVNLLPRFYDVSAGRITVDGVDIRDTRLESLRGLMGFVTQEVVLFNDTVRNNIAYGRSGVAESLNANVEWKTGGEEQLIFVAGGILGRQITFKWYDDFGKGENAGVNYAKLIDEDKFTHEGKIDFVDNAIDRSSGTIRGSCTGPKCSTRTTTSSPG